MATLAPPEVIPNPAGEPLAGNYFVAVYPPYSAWRSNYVSTLQYALNDPPSGAPLGLYVHIPFCQKKCDFCYHLSTAGQSVASVNRYLEAVVREFELYAQRPALQDRDVAFVYISGGTPSLLTTAQLEFLIEGLHGLLNWKKVTEVCFEVAPRSVRRELLHLLRELGVTRISMGVQSFDDGVLKTNGRIHLANDVRHAYELIREAQFHSVNLDLMCGLAGETSENWRHSIEETLKLSPDSVTIYQTEMAANTQVYRDLKANRLRSFPATWETKRTRLFYGFDALERAGYTVIDAYRAVKDADLDRFKYEDFLWHGADVLGLGASACGYVDGIHVQNQNSVDEYISAVERQTLPVLRAYSLSDWDQLVREFILQLKFGEVDAKGLYRKYGVDITEAFAAQLEELSMEGFLIFSKFGVRLTRAGLLRVDRILPRFYDPKFRDTQSS